MVLVLILKDNMKRGFIRCAWGIYDNTHRITARRQKIDKDIACVKACKFNEPFKVYVYGKDNYDRLKNDFDCKLIDDNPAPFDLIKHQYRHKLELLKYAMEVDGYDELVYMDWDCIPQKKLADDFWDKCALKGPIQGCLQQYHKIKCGWRNDSRRKVMNGGFLYIRDKTIPSRAIQIWETMKQDNDEPAYAKLIDDLMGGWTNWEESGKKFWDNYETQFCAIIRGNIWPEELRKTKDVCFFHFI